MKLLDMSKKVLKINGNLLYVGTEGKMDSKEEEKFIDLSKVSVIELQPNGFGDGNVKILGSNGNLKQTIILPIPLTTLNISSIAYDYFNTFASQNLIEYGFVKLETNIPVWVKVEHNSVKAQDQIEDRPIPIFYESKDIWGVISFNLLIIFGVLFVVLGIFTKVFILLIPGIGFFIIGLFIANKFELIKKNWNKNRELLQIDKLVEKK